MAAHEQTDEHALDTASSSKLRRRGLVAGAAARGATALAKQGSSPVAAYDSTHTFQSVVGFCGGVDANADGIQGYAAGANNTGVFGRNNDFNGVGVWGAGTNGNGVYGQSQHGTGVAGNSSSGYGVGGQSTSSIGGGVMRSLSLRHSLLFTNSDESVTGIDENADFCSIG